MSIIDAIEFIVICTVGGLIGMFIATIAARWL